MIFREKDLRICLTPSDQDMKKQSDPTMALGYAWLTPALLLFTIRTPNTPFTGLAGIQLHDKLGEDRQLRPLCYFGGFFGQYFNENTRI